MFDRDSYMLEHMLGQKLARGGVAPTRDQLAKQNAQRTRLLKLEVEAKQNRRQVLEALQVALAKISTSIVGGLSALFNAGRLSSGEPRSS